MTQLKPRHLLIAASLVLVGATAVIADDLADHAADLLRGEDMKRQKAAHEQQMRARNNTRARGATFRRDLLPPPPADEPEAAWELGIFQDTEAPLPSSQYRFVSRWVGVAGDEYVVVHSGALTRQHRRGVLAVFTYPRENTAAPSSLHVYRTRLRGGSLRITNAEGSVLTLDPETGPPLKFDVASRSFDD